MSIELFMPARRAFRTRRVIARRSFARIAKTHGDNGDFVRIVKLSRGQAQPGAQPVAGRIVPGNAGFVYFSARRLTDNLQPCRSMRLHDRARTGWQRVRTMRASADMAKQLRQSLAHFPRAKTPIERWIVAADR